MTVSVTEEDMVLAHCLQVSPRASWAAIARVVGRSPDTLERRWEHLTDAGLVWITAVPGERMTKVASLSYVGIACAPAETARVADALAQEAEALSVEITTGRYDLLLTIAAANLTAMTTCLLERIDTVPGVLKTHAMLATTVYKVGTEWRLSSLDQNQISSLLRAERKPSSWARAAPLSDLDRSLRNALVVDGRLSYAELARRTGVSRSSVQRRVNWMIRNNVFGIRCEVAGPAFGWPISASFGLEVPPELLAPVGQSLARNRNVRLVAAVADRPNIFVTCWLRTLQDLLPFEAQLMTDYPQARIRDRYVNLYATKRMGRLLNRQGRASGDVIPPPSLE